MENSIGFYIVQTVPIVVLVIMVCIGFDNYSHLFKSQVGGISKAIMWLFVGLHCANCAQI